MVEIKRVPYDFLEDDYNRYVEKKGNIEADFDARKELAIANIVAEIDAEKEKAVGIFDRLIAECSYDLEVETEENVVEEEKTEEPMGE